MIISGNDTTNNGIGNNEKSPTFTDRFSFIATTIYTLNITVYNKSEITNTLLYLGFL